jgi:hypothetical protein
MISDVERLLIPANSVDLFYKKSLSDFSKRLQVAGAGLEPTTFGL